MNDHAPTTDHRKLLGWLHIVYGGILVAAGSMMFLFYNVAMIVLARQGRSMSLPDFMSWLPLVVCAGLVVASAPNLIAGFGLLNRRRWARTVALIAGVLHIASVPLGTALGVYTIWFFTQDSEAQRAQPRARRAAS